MKLIIVPSDSENPRTAFDHIGNMATKHRRYDLGEENIIEPIDWLEMKLETRKLGEYTDARFQELSARFLEKFMALPLYLYDHSGISISTSPFSCGWDSGQVGFIYTTKEKVREGYGVKNVTKKVRERAMRCLQLEVEEFNQYLNGEIYAFQILDEDDEVIDSCGGFYGDDFLNNGMLDYIDREVLGVTEEELTELLTNIIVSYDY